MYAVDGAAGQDFVSETDITLRRQPWYNGRTPYMEKIMISEIHLFPTSYVLEEPNEPSTNFLGGPVLLLGLID